MTPNTLKPKVFALMAVISVCVTLALLQYRRRNNSLLSTQQDPIRPRNEVTGPKVSNDSCDNFMCRFKTLSQWKSFFLNSAVALKPFPPEGEYIFSWEKEYLSFPSLVDSKTLPDLSLSSVIMTSQNGAEVACDVGQRLTGRLDVKDGYGRQRHDGMDEVRVWMVDTAYSKRRATGQVVDFRNGSYGLEITCLWPGSVAKLRVAVSYPREFVRSAIDQVRRGVTRYTAGHFRSKEGVEETTVCHPTPNVPGRDCICNFTSFNSREFYCGKPLDKRLDCSHWTSTTPLGIMKPYHVTSAERMLIKNIPGPAAKRTLRTNISIRTSGSGHLPKVPKCSEMPLRVTWDMTTRPQGFWDKNGAWQSLKCQNMKFPRQSFLKCLKDSQIFVIGDSNSNRMYNYLVDQTSSNKKLHGGPLRMEWSTKDQSFNKQWKINVTRLPHEYPAYLSDGSPLLQYGSVEKIIDGIPSTGGQLVILHYYLHLTPFHLSVARSRVEAAARAISRLLARNPEARVAFRGPHVSSDGWNFNHSIGGDALGKQYMDIISTAFANLKDRVYFLDGWEMTTALENAELHPNDKVPHEMVLMFLSFLCK